MEREKEKENEKENENFDIKRFENLSLGKQLIFIEKYCLNYKYSLSDLILILRTLPSEPGDSLKLEIVSTLFPKIFHETLEWWEQLMFDPCQTAKILSKECDPKWTTLRQQQIEKILSPFPLQFKHKVSCNPLFSLRSLGETFELKKREFENAFLNKKHNLKKIKEKEIELLEQAIQKKKQELAEETSRLETLFQKTILPYNSGLEMICRLFEEEGENYYQSESLNQKKEKQLFDQEEDDDDEPLYARILEKQIRNTKPIDPIF
jgi:hypothetical protein